MKKIKNNTILANELFKDEIRKSLILHIPHSSLYIPTDSSYNVTESDLREEILKLTDLGTDKIFDLGPEVTKVIFPYNRVYCDVERLPDELEELYHKGRGFYYTKRDNGSELRNLDNKETVISIYNTYHEKLTNVVKEKLETIGFVNIIDCHSFSDYPFDSDLDKSENRPDICLGVDNFHTPDWLVTLCKNYFTELGYNVKINSPYSGTLVPLKYYKKNNKVNSIMIEINRKLFLDKNNIDLEKIYSLNKIISDIFSKD